MSNPSNETSFNTPNPSELKKAAKEDPVFDKESDKEGDVIVEHPMKDDVRDEELGRPDAADLGNSQTTIANMGGR